MNVYKQSIVLGLVLILFPVAIGAQSNWIDITQSALVVPPSLTNQEKQAVQMLIEEVEKRTQVCWPTTSDWPQNDNPRIIIGQTSALQTLGFDGQIPTWDTPPAEGFRIWIDPTANPHTLILAGNDERGVLFSVGYLMRSLRMSKQQIHCPNPISVVTSPHYPLRGHQIGYRPKPNSYDGWTLEMMEQYIRDLIAFGVNAIELIPPRSDDREDSPHFPLPQMETMIGMSSICERYGIDVWIWYPAMDDDYSDPQTVGFALREWGDVFRKLPRVDAIFVPCGDPGHTPSNLLMPMLEKQAKQLQQIHPQAKWWIAPQGFDPPRMEQFHDLISQNPSWLTGIVYGPWIRMTLPEFREWIPARYPIRHYPDITHSIYAQYPVPDWDPAFSLTEGREVINPRPLDQTHIFQTYQPYTMGFITYSEGCNDDVNKIIWSGLGWNPEAKPIDILREYSRYFIGPNYEDDFAQGLLALEKNWQGPVIGHSEIDRTLQQFQSMQQSANPQDRLNWRFQQGLFRAYYDAYVRQRLLQETQLEQEALSILHDTERLGSVTAMDEARKILQQSILKPVALTMRQALFELAESLYQSIRMQLDTKRYQAGRSDGAVLDRIDAPLNNRLWLIQKFDEIRTLPTERERLIEIDRIVNWKNPGPGGFYDDLGNPGDQPHLLKGMGFHEDPTLYKTIRNNPDNSALSDPSVGLPFSWNTLAVSLYDTPIQMRYDDLDANSHYKIRVVYADGPVRLVADDEYEIHPFLDSRYQVLEFDVPQPATQDGELRLTWRKPIGIKHSGRRNEICEIWLMKK